MPDRRGREQDDRKRSLIGKTVNREMVKVADLRSGERGYKNSG